MKLATVLIVLAFGLLPQVATPATPGFTPLLDSENWNVFRFTATPNDPSGMPDYCSAKTGNPFEFLEFSAFRERDLACINTESSSLNFQPGKARVGYRMGETGFYVDPANYLPSGVLLCSSRQTVDGIIDRLMAGYRDGAAFQVLDPDGRVLASFPTGGMKDALDAWQACRKWE